METTLLQTNLTVLGPSQDKQVAESGNVVSSSFPKVRRTSSRFRQVTSSNDPVTSPEGLSTRKKNLRNKASCSMKEPSCMEGGTCCALKDPRTPRTKRNENKTTTHVGTNIPPSCGPASAKDPPIIAETTVDREPMSSNRRQSSREVAHEQGSLAYGRVGKRASGSMNLAARKLKEPFPVVLHRMINETDTSIIWWDTCGKSFGVNMSSEKLPSILYLHFGTKSKAASFRRQLNTYGFIKHSTGKSLGYFHHRHFDRNSTQNDLIKYIRRRESGKRSPESELASNAVKPVTDPSTKKAAKRNNRREPRTDQTAATNASRRTHRKHSLQPSCAFPDSSFDPTRSNDFLTYDQRSVAEAFDIIEPLAIMSLPLIKTPQKLDGPASPWAKGCFSDGPGTRTFVSTDTPTVFPSPAKPASCESLMGLMRLPLVDNANHTWSLSPPTERTIRAGAWTAMSPSIMRFSPCSYDQRIRLVPAVSVPVPLWHKENWNSSHAETGPILPINRGHGFDRLPTREFISASVLSAHNTLKDDRHEMPRNSRARKL